MFGTLSAMSPISQLNINTKIFKTRPFLSTSKKELELISKKTVFGTFIKDPSNKNKKFLRSSIREDTSYFKKIWNKGRSNNKIY